MALAYRDADVTDYHISEHTGRRVNDARVRSRLFDMRRILSKGFTSHEVDAIINIIRPYWEAGEPLDVNAVSDQLHARSFPRDEAQQLARIFARM